MVKIGTVAKNLSRDEVAGRRGKLESIVQPFSPRGLSQRIAFDAQTGVFYLLQHAERQPIPALTVATNDYWNSSLRTAQLGKLACRRKVPYVGVKLSLQHQRNA
jgi:hypothetical protein